MDFEVLKRFWEDRDAVEDYKRSGRPSTGIIAYNLANVHVVQNRRQTIQDMVEAVWT